MCMQTHQRLAFATSKQIGILCVNFVPYHAYDSGPLIFLAKTRVYPKQRACVWRFEILRVNFVPYHAYDSDPFIFVDQNTGCIPSSEPVLAVMFF